MFRLNLLVFHFLGANIYLPVIWLEKQSSIYLVWEIPTFFVFWVYVAFLCCFWLQLSRQHFWWKKVFEDPNWWEFKLVLCWNPRRHNSAAPCWGERHFSRPIWTRGSLLKAKYSVNIETSIYFLTLIFSGKWLICSLKDYNYCIYQQDLKLEKWIRFWQGCLIWQIMPIGGITNITKMKRWKSLKISRTDLKNMIQTVDFSYIKFSIYNDAMMIMLTRSHKISNWEVFI